jgi:pantoate kinase
MDNKASTFSLFKNILTSGNSSDFIGSGFSPAHITGILIRQTKQQELNVYFNGKLISGETTKAAIINLIGEQKLEIDVFSISNLFLSQGFGLSGAGALSTVIALNSALGLDKSFSELVNAAHKAEIQNQTGLGDVIAQATGGVVYRKFAGGYNFGKVEQLNISPPDNQVTICVLGHKLSTRSIITDLEHKKNINQIASKYIADPQNSRSNTDSDPTIPSTFEDLMKLSYSFASASGLMDHRVFELIKRIHSSSAGLASMIMLGNSIFAVGDHEKIETICGDFGTVIHCKVSQNGAHLTEWSDLGNLKLANLAKK